MTKTSRDFNEFLAEQLKDPELAAAYLNEHFHYDGPHYKELLLNAFKSVLEAQGFSKISKKSGISRRALYKAFSKNGNPTLETLHSLLEAIGISILFSASQNKKKTKSKHRKSSTPLR
jgi:probable addiction module antidote protein